MLLAGPGSWYPPNENVEIAIQSSFRKYLPERGADSELLTVATLWWYCRCSSFSYDQRLSLFSGFLSTVAARLGLSSWSPDGRGVPGNPPPPDVYLTDVFHDSAALHRFRQWAATHPPMNPPASFDSDRLERRRSTQRSSGPQQVMFSASSRKGQEARKEQRSSCHYCRAPPPSYLEIMRRQSIKASIFHIRGTFVSGGRLCHLRVRH